MGVSAKGVNALQSVGGLVSAVNGMRSQQRGSEKTNEYERLAVLSEQEAERRAKSRRDAASDERDKLRAQQRKVQARNRTAWGRSGVSLSSGSPLAVMQGQALEDEQEQLDVLAAGDKAASAELSSGNTAANRYRSQAKALRNSATSGYGANALGLGGSLLSRGGRVFDL
ncbi:MAG: hypothetical protein AB7E32_04155 [Desulfovibrio sp.]